MQISLGRNVASVAAVIILCFLGPACGDDKQAQLAPDARARADANSIDAEPAFDARPDANPLMPMRLADTGLCVDDACAQINPGISAYTPRWQLFADGATKKRWIYFPPGAKVDTTEMDYWRFPMGTKVWKEFTRDNIRLETRLMLKTGPLDKDWLMVSFAWNQAQNDAVAVPSGQIDANGTMHDIPSKANCKACHDSVSGRVLGFNALSLDYDNPVVGEIDLSDAIARDLLSAPPVGGATKFPLPGTAREQDALGYLHANCGHCHNPRSAVHQNQPLELRLEVGKLASLGATPTYVTSVGVTGDRLNGFDNIVVPGQPNSSTLYLRLLQTGTLRMPLLGTETIDQAGRAAVEAWITNIPPP